MATQQNTTINNGTTQNQPNVQQQVAPGGLPLPPGVAAAAPAAVVVQPVNQAAQNGLNNANMNHICGFFCDHDDAKHVDRIFSTFGVPRNH